MTMESILDIFPWLYTAAIIVFVALYVIDTVRNDYAPEDYCTPGRTYVSCAYISVSGMICALSVKNILETSENFSPVLAIIIELAFLIFIIHFLCRVLRLLRSVMKERKESSQQSKKKAHSLIYGKPTIGRINPIDPDSELFSNPDRCPICCLTFDAADELRINLKKDGYEDCFFCPRCGRELKNYREPCHPVDT